MECLMDIKFISIKIESSLKSPAKGSCFCKNLSQRSLTKLLSLYFSLTALYAYKYLGERNLTRTYVLCRHTGPVIVPCSSLNY